jgi:choline transport protein
MILSKFIGRIHPQLQVPVYALLANAVVIFIIGCIYLASSTAFNALIGTGLVLQQVSFCFPVALLIFRRRSSTYLPPHRFFNMGNLGWVSNIATLVFGIVTLVFYNFPAEMPVTGGNMSTFATFLNLASILL